MTAATIEPKTDNQLMTLTEAASAVGRSYPFIALRYKRGELEGAFQIGRTIAVPRETVERLKAEIASKSAN